MTAKELLDVFSPAMELIGVKPRDEVHREGLWHQTFHCWLLYRAQNTNYILFQKRHADKQDFPSQLDITAAGHLEAGEGPDDGVRELKEELGIDVPIGDLTSLGIFPNVIITDKIVDKEFSHVYLYEFKGQIADLVLQGDEVESIIQIEVDQFRSFIREHLDYITGQEYMLDQITMREVELSRSDFVPHEQAYYGFIISQIDALI